MPIICILRWNEIVIPFLKGEKNLADYIKPIKDLLLFKEPKNAEKFILKENQRDKEQEKQENLKPWYGF